MRRISMLILAALVLAIAAPAIQAGPFSDVPRGHWAYRAIEKSVEAGILQGYDGKFHGSKTLNRYQMAVVVARMLDRIETMGPGKVGKKDIENLEALTIEFADELALLNVKVSTLEDGFADLKRDVDLLKRDFAAGGARAGISGLIQGRLALTDDDPNHFQGRGAAAVAQATGVTGGAIAGNQNTPFAASAGGVPGAAATGVAGTLPLARYTGGVPTGPNATTSGDGRTLFNLAQTSIGFDRHFDEDFYVHMQLDIDADNEAGFISGNSIQVNEAYVDLERWLADGDIRVRAGTWALPFQRERNPEMVEYPNQLRYGFRSLDLTISPTFWDSNWETVRNLGVGLWNGKDSGFQWQVAASNNTANNYNSDGSLVAWKSAAAKGSNMTTPFVAGAAGTAGAVRPVGAAAFGGTQLTQNSSDLTRGGSGLWGDQLGSIDTNNSAGIQNEIGFYGWIGDKYDSGFRWDLGYFNNGGNIAPGAGEIGTASEWDGFQFNAGYWGWENWGFMASYYSSTSTSQNFGGTPVGGARNFVELGLFPLLAAGTAYPDVDSEAWSVLVNYKFNDDNNVTLRYEDLSDDLGAAAIEATVLTFNWNHRISKNSLLQLEYVSPESESVTVAAGGAAAGGVVGGTGAATRNTVDVNDDLFQINYKVRF